MKYVWLLLLHYFHEISSIKSLFNKRQSRNSCFDLRTTADSNSGVKKVAKIVRFFAKREKKNCKYLFITQGSNLQ